MDSRKNETGNSRNRANSVDKIPVAEETFTPMLNEPKSKQTLDSVDRGLGHNQFELKKLEDEEYIERCGTESDDYNNRSSDSSGVSPTCRFIETAQEKSSLFLQKHKKKLSYVVGGILILAYAAYFLAACIKDVKRAQPLIIITSLVVAWLGYKIIHMLFASKINNKCWGPLKEKLKPKWCIIKWTSIIAVALMVVVVVTIVIGRRVQQYTGLAGLTFFIIVLFITSKNPSKVNWRPVLWGMLLNFLFALFILKTDFGLSMFKFIAQQVTTFLGYTSAGSDFVFGPAVSNHFFAFKILPTIVFFSCVISLLYYIGVMQFVISKIAFLMQITMGTTATESLSCAGNIFVGQTEAPILIRPFLADMTKSELHAVMTGGFATIAGGVLAAYIGMGIDPVHLICASVMNAPMALAISKLTYPETEKPVYLREGTIKFAKPTEQNFIEAAAAGASQSIGLVANIAANLLAFLSLLAFVNAVLSWIGSMIDYPELSFELICSYVFWIIPLLMGVEYKDCKNAAELIGTKLVINEFIAYEKLGKFIANRETCTYPYISRRSELIITYALCGFANLSSIGIQLGGIGAMAPQRSADLANLVLRALFAGTIASLMTASLAGMLITDYDTIDHCAIAGAVLNVTVNGTDSLTYNTPLN